MKNRKLLISFFLLVSGIFFYQKAFSFDRNVLTATPPQRLATINSALDGIESSRGQPTNKTKRYQSLNDKSFYGFEGLKNIASQPIDSGSSDNPEDIKAKARADYELYKKKKKNLVEKQTRRTKKEIINKTLEDAVFKLTFDLMFLKGEQIFKVINSQGDALSQLTYPIKGQMGVVSAELRIHPKISIGGRFGASNFKNRTSKDEDWNFASGWVYQITEQDTRNQAKFWDLNIYYRLADWRKERLNDNFAKFFLLERFYIDGFGGWQYYNARHMMLDPTTEFLKQDTAGVWWTTSLPYNDGLNSSYEVSYKGPRLGVRFGGSMTEKLSTTISLAYAWLHTKGIGNWNLRNYNFWQRGDNGRAFNMDFETLYHITPNWFIGVGFNYMSYSESELTESGVATNAASYEDLDIIRDVNQYAYGPYLKFGYRW